MTDNKIYKVDIEKYLEEFKKNYLKQEFPLVSSKTVFHNGIRKPLWWFYKNGVKREEIILPVKNITMYDYKLTDIKIMKCNELYNQFIDRISMITNDKLKSDFTSKKEEIEVLKAKEPKELYLKDLNDLKKNFK